MAAIGTGALVLAGLLLHLQPLTVVSASMEPRLDVGDVVLVDSIPLATVATADIITYRDPQGSGRLVTHRVQSISVDGNRATVGTRGDASPGTETWSAPANQRVGRVVRTIPNVGLAHLWFHRYAKAWTLPLVLIVLGAAALLRVVGRARSQVVAPRTRRQRRRKVTRIPRLIAPAALLAFAASTTGVTWALFSATTANPSNTYTAASITMTDDDSDAPMLTLSNQNPGDTDTRCISVTYNGTGRARVVLHGTTTGTGLDRHAGLQVTRGTMPAGQFNTCTGFTADTRVHLAGQPAGVVYVGTVEGYPDSAAAAFRDTPGNLTWANGETHAYKFQLWTGSNRAAEGKNITQTFSWEAQGVASRYDATVLATAGLVSYWRLNEPSGTTAWDAAGANTGTHRNTPSLGQPGALTADADPATTFNGTDEYVEIGSPADLRPASFTIEAWFKTTPSADTMMIFRARTGYDLRVLADGRVLGQFISSFGPHDTSSSFSPRLDDGAWHHAAFTRDGTGAKLYVDGEHVGSDPTTAAVVYSGGAVAIGRDGDNSANYFNGSIDDVAFYNVALTAAQIKAHYDAR